MQTGRTFGWLSEPVGDYEKGLDGAKTLTALRAYLESWREVAGDAWAAVQDWTEADFTAWRKALASERRGKFMGDEAMARFACVLLPEVLFRVSVIANEYKAPWGVAYHRAIDAKLIVVADGIATLQPPPVPEQAP